MPHPAKATIVEDLHKKLNASPFLFVADYTGLKVDQFAELRNRLHTAGRPGADTLGPAGADNIVPAPVRPAPQDQS